MTPDQVRARRLALVFVLFRLVLAVGALGAVAYGAWRIYEPAGYIVGGGLVWLELARSGRRPKREGGPTA